MFKALVLAESKGIINSETRFDEGITKAEAVEMLVNTLMQETGIPTFNFKQGKVEGYEVEEADENTGGVDVELNDDEYQGENPYDKEVDNYEGMTPEQIAQQLIADYLKDNAQSQQGNWELPPGATPYDPSKDGSAAQDYNVELPDWAKGDYIN